MAGRRARAAAAPRGGGARGDGRADYFGSSFSSTRERGRWRRLGPATEGFATFHPSAILRTPDEQRAAMYRRLVQDLSEIAKRTKAA